MTERIYLDWNATAPLRPAVRAAMLAALDRVGNPSSVHTEGRAARRLVETAREQVAALVGAEPGNVILTSGGTEANALALGPFIDCAGGRGRFNRLLVSAVEHPSVRGGGRFPLDAIEEIPVTPAGIVDLARLETRLTELCGAGERALVSIMHANNETGVVQPVAAAAALAHAAGGLLHVDAVQTAGRIPCDIKALGADLVTLSGHKLGGPQGSGALVKASERVHLADPLFRGGSQERGNRAGTENVAAIAGFGAAGQAAGEALAADRARMAALRERLETGLLAAAEGTVIFGQGAERLPNTTMFAVPGHKAETAIMALDLEGIAASSGSACSSGKVAASHVLHAMGVSPELAAGAVRLSLGWDTTEPEIDGFLTAWRKLVSRLSRGVKRGLAA
ncbi:MAG TPA: cysteine desulfurase family protein [Xanthobacteraceae bacterium]|nr:cysteine desulfurase family protein [Xanthobacteraceae bacterium]